MKPDGVTMETMEPSEAAEVAEPSSSSPENILEQATSQPDEPANDAAPPAVPKANGKTALADPKNKPKVAVPKTTKSAGASGPSSRPGTASHRTANDVRSTNSVPAAGVKKTLTATTTKTSSVGAAASKRPVGVAAAVSSTVKNQTKVPDRKPAGAARSTSAATASNSTKPAAVNGTKKKPGTETVSVARPKMTGMTSRPATSTAPKPSATSTAKPGAAALSRTTRPVTGPSTSRPASTTSRPTTAPPKSSTTAAAKTTAPRVTTAPSTGRTTSAQPPKAAPAKKDVSRPPSAPVAKKPLTTTTASSAARKPEPSKPTAAVKVNTASKWSTTTKAADPKVPQAKTQQPVKSTPTKKPVAAVRFPAPKKPPLDRTPPASPANKSASNTTSQAKRGTKPTQAVSPFPATKKMGGKSAAAPAAEAQAAAAEAQAAAAAEAQTAAAAEAQTTAAAEAQTTAAAEAQTTAAAEAQTAAAAEAETAAAAVVATVAVAAAVVGAAAEAVTEPTETETKDAASAPEHVTPSVPAQGTTPEVAQTLATTSPPPQSPVRTTSAEPSPPQEQPESSAPLLTTEEQMPSSPPVASPHTPPEEPLDLLTDQTPSTSKAPPAEAGAAIPQIAPPSNLNEEEDEEEREGSQLVSVSEMSGTTQPTEESRPGSAGPFGGSAWRAGGALLSELDSEDVSGSQQGASELSAPGVLEGTESTDDLGDGSLKGAMDMEGASAGSPDFEKVPEIPANDFEEDEDDDDDDNDRVCDMDVGSERADEPQRPRHDNDVEDDDDDEDVEMASEGVTESGLESYGNADEDDFVEDERLDNLNRAVQPPPPPPLLPSAPAAQWDQPNPAADPWAELLQPQQLLEQPTNMAGAAAAASPSVDPWQADSETPTQIPAQAWLEVGSSPLTPEHQEAPHPSSVGEEPKNVEAQMYMIQCSTAPMPIQTQGLAPTPPLSAPGMSLSSTLSSETSTPEELGDYSRDVKPEPQDAQAAVISPQPDPDGSGQETPPAADAAPASNPSSSSVSEDEASDTEGEAQLEDSLEGPLISNMLSATFDSQPAAAQRCLSTVEEGEEAEVEEGGGVGEDTTPPSATSLTSYGFDTMTTASNAQSTAESCIKSPGIFSLEELPEEAKDPGLIPQPLSQSGLSEQQYIECVKQETESSADHIRAEAPEPEEALDAPSAANTLRQPEENPDDLQPPYYSAICEKTENSFAGLTALPHHHRRDHAAQPRTYCDIIKPQGAAAVTPPKLTCADLPPRSPGQQALSPQLRRLEQHQRQLLELQQRREQQSRPLEEAEQERKRREEEEQRKKKEEAEEEIKRNKEEEERKRLEEEEKSRNEAEHKERKDLELQLQQQQEELKQRQQIMQWQQELQQQQPSKGQTVLLSPSSGLCTIYEALENTDEDELDDDEEGIKELKSIKKKKLKPHEDLTENCEKPTPLEDQHRDLSPSPETLPPLNDSPQPPSLPDSPERPPPLDLDWGKKVDIVQQLINQTLLLNRDGCSSLLLLPGGAGGTLSPLESSLWPSLLPPLTPPSATITSVSSFSPEASGSSPQGEWTVVELETHH